MYMHTRDSIKLKYFKRFSFFRNVNVEVFKFRGNNLDYDDVMEIIHF